MLIGEYVDTMTRRFSNVIRRIALMTSLQNSAHKDGDKYSWASSSIRTLFELIIESRNALRILVK